MILGVIEQLRALPQELLRFSGVVSPDDAELMREATDRGCEQVDVNEW